MTEVLVSGTAKELVFRMAKIADADEKVYDVIPHEEKRNLNQNGLYWKLVGMVADKHRISKAHLHNDMLCSFGQKMFIDGKCVFVTLPDTEESEETAKESTTVHLMPTSKTIQGNDGITYRYWAMLRGSHDYTVKEFSVLLDGLMQEAKQLGLNVISDDELAHMRMLEQQIEDKKNAQKNKSVADTYEDKKNRL